jgi:hypothetical protein
VIRPPSGIRVRAHGFASCRTAARIPSREGIPEVCHGLSRYAVTLGNENTGQSASSLQRGNALTGIPHASENNTRRSEPPIGQLRSAFGHVNVRNAVTSTNTLTENAS